MLSADNYVDETPENLNKIENQEDKITKKKNCAGWSRFVAREQEMWNLVEPPPEKKAINYRMDLQS